VVSGDCSEDCVHRTDDVQLDNGTPVYTLLPECRRRVDTLKLCIVWGVTKAHGRTRGQHSRRSVVDLPGGRVSDRMSGKRAEITRTRLALTQKENANDLVFLIRLSFGADGLVYGLRNAASVFFARKTDRPGFGCFILRGSEGCGEGVIVVCARAHETCDETTDGSIWRGQNDVHRDAARTEDKRGSE
jgi:hypothetical protein